MRRLVIVLGLAALLASASGAARTQAPATAIFYYPWFGTPAVDGAWQHWQQNDHHPPADIAAAYYPARGAYSSSDRRVLSAQMRDIARAGIAQVVVSWWGRGSPEDARLPAVLAAIRTAGLTPAVHLEPYGGRTVESLRADIQYLEARDVTEFFVYQPADISAASWRTLLGRVAGQFYAQTTQVGFAKDAGFDGVYSYDIRTWGGASFARLCSQAHHVGLACLPSVGPGFDAGRATPDSRVKRRNDGKTYDSMWHAALVAHPDAITITSYNEWNEGTQIEPARVRAGYASYDGAWHRHGAAAQRAYLARTRYWTAKTSAPQP